MLVAPATATVNTASCPSWTVTAAAATDTSSTSLSVIVPVARAVASVALDGLLSVTVKVSSPSARLSSSGKSTRMICCVASLPKVRLPVAAT